MRLGKVKFEISYVVDLDCAEMVEQAIEYVNEDLIENIIKSDNTSELIKVEEDLNEKLKPEDIPESLTENFYYCDRCENFFSEESGEIPPKDHSEYGVSCRNCLTEPLDKIEYEPTCEFCRDRGCERCL